MGTIDTGQRARMSTATIGSACARCGTPSRGGARFCGGCGAATGLAQPTGLATVSGARPTTARAAWRRGLGAASHAAGDLLYVVIAAVLALVLSHLPVLDVLIYPFKLFGTFVHEWSHALVALATGGHVVALQINPDLSGEEWSAGGMGLLIDSAGYIGVAVAGSALLLAPLRWANRTLTGIGAAALLLPLASAVLQGANFTLTTWFWSAVFAAVALVVGARATPRLARLFQQFLAVELCLTALDALRQLIWLALNAPRATTDATIAAAATGIPAPLWAVVWSIVALIAIGLAAVRVTRRLLSA